MSQPRVGLQILGQAEIDDMRPVLAIEQDIRGLQVTVKDAPLMREVNRSCHRRQQSGGGAGLLEQARDPLDKAATFDQLHAVIVQALMLAHFVDRDDVRVIEPGGRLGFNPEPATSDSEANRPARISFKATTRLRLTCRAL